MPRQREPAINLIFYYAFKWSIVSPAFHGLYSGRIYGSEHIPRSGPAILVSNHASNFDPPFISNCAGRPVAYMAKEELFRIPILKQAIQIYGAYPVKRGGMVRQSLDAAQRALDRGWLVGIFPNGTRTADGRIHKPQLGAAAIAAKAQVPLIPMSLWGSEAIQPQGKRFPQAGCPITVRIGLPIAPPSTSDRAELQRKMEDCVTAVHALLDLGR
ncbi:MAG: lysophospholipid acyltransferase family protein [Cyanobacteria bacterium P01_D01_bin.123]